MKVWEYLARQNFQSNKPNITIDELIETKPDQVIVLVGRWLKNNRCTPREVLLMIPAKQRLSITGDTIDQILMSDLCFFEPKIIRGKGKTTVQVELNEVVPFEPKIIQGGVD